MNQSGRIDQRRQEAADADRRKPRAATGAEAVASRSTADPAPSAPTARSACGPLRSTGLTCISCTTSTRRSLAPPAVTEHRAARRGQQARHDPRFGRPARPHRFRSRGPRRLSCRACHNLKVASPAGALFSVPSREWKRTGTGLSTVTVRVVVSTSTRRRPCGVGTAPRSRCRLPGWGAIRAVV
jgi:hypothetical protein